MQQASHDKSCIGLGNRLDDPPPAGSNSLGPTPAKVRAKSGEDQFGWSEMELSTN